MSNSLKFKKCSCPNVTVSVNITVWKPTSEHQQNTGDRTLCLKHKAEMTWLTLYGDAERHPTKC